ncbi:hypothetical protein AKJ09_05948 [Labilithrix luteola]|uniref:CASP-like protein n=1 Tax=Labilithrix luteola TaxID=1391654 RepID=A0A0K1Q1L0_9BACT|nr:hypothetical protein [Labilithrix luteola]AKU99284.1 hypothetical protein AKJ09_05948 [Labilithrix luteola]
MYREHAGPPPPDPLEKARQNARTCGLIQLGTAVTTLVTLSSLALQLATSTVPRRMGIDPVVYAEFKTTALLVGLAWSAVQGAWAGINHWGLQRRSKAAFVSSVLFALTNVFTCFTSIFGGILLYFLFRREMKDWFASRIGTSPR